MTSLRRLSTSANRNVGTTANLLLSMSANTVPGFDKLSKPEKLKVIELERNTAQLQNTLGTHADRLHTTLSEARADLTSLDPQNAAGQKLDRDTRNNLKSLYDARLTEFIPVANEVTERINQRQDLNHQFKQFIQEKNKSMAELSKYLGDDTRNKSPQEIKNTLDSVLSSLKRKQDEISSGISSWDRNASVAESKLGPMKDKISQSLRDSNLERPKKDAQPTPTRGN